MKKTLLTLSIFAFVSCDEAVKQLDKATEKLDQATDEVTKKLEEAIEEEDPTSNVTPLKTDEELLEELLKKKFVALKGTILETEGEVLQVRITRKSHDWRKVEKIVSTTGGNGQPEMFDKKYDLSSLSTKETAYINTKGSPIEADEQEKFTTTYLYAIDASIKNTRGITSLYYSDAKEALKALKERDISRYNEELSDAVK